MQRLAGSHRTIPTMSALSWLRIVRRVPGLGSQPELPNLETLIDEEALKTKDGFHIARWVVPLVATVVGTAVFLPLSLVVSPYFLFGAIGLPMLGGLLGLIFHLVARRIPRERIRLRKRCYKLLERLNGLRNLLGFTPVLSESVAAVLDEAASLYLRVRPSQTLDAERSEPIWSSAVDRARSAMDDAMAQMLTLAEPETAAAQEAELARGWAPLLLEEMRTTVQAIEEQRAKALVTGVGEVQLSALAGLMNARQELNRLETAVNELEQEQETR